MEGLCLVLTRQLPLAQALPALRALDGLLHQLAAAGGLEAEQLLQQAEAPPAQAHPNADEGATLEAPAATAGSPATLLPLTAAMLSAVPQVSTHGL